MLINLGLDLSSFLLRLQYESSGPFHKDGNRDKEKYPLDVRSNDQVKGYDEERAKEILLHKTWPLLMTETS